MSARPGFTSRLIDLLSVVLVLAGGAVYLNSYLGMQELRSRPHEEFVRGETVAFGRTAEHAKLTRISHIGLGIVALGILVGLSAAAHARQIEKRRQTAAAS
ncbi:MAG TPA: hypothetical protein VEB19_08430 [Gemmatimonadaceae bacterium]|nr:hypothetical protein [Gemmatimonadaceae bacterium]